jgi:hypothetical protein
MQRLLKFIVLLNDVRGIKMDASGEGVSKQMRKPYNGPGRIDHLPL